MPITITKYTYILNTPCIASPWLSGEGCQKNSNKWIFGFNPECWLILIVGIFQENIGYPNNHGLAVVV